MKRRDFNALLSAAAAGLLVPRRALAIGPSTLFTIARINWSGDWNSRPNAARRMMAEVEKATSVDVAEAPLDLAADDLKIFDSPFLYLSGGPGSAFPTFSAKAREVLSRYLRFGGFLLVDNCSGDAAGEFDKGFRREMAQLLPDSKIEKLDDDHSIYRSFFLINRVCGRTADRNYLEGINIADWTPVVYMADDLGGALERDPFGNYKFDATPGGEEQRSWATRLAVNLVLYALTVNYKKDQIHVEAILRRRRH